MELIDPIKTLIALRDLRAARRRDAEKMGALLKQGYDQMVEMFEQSSLTDPITEEALLKFTWTTLESRGYSLGVSAFGDEFGFALEVYYEHGGVLGSGIKANDPEKTDEFYERVFRGTPLRLEDRTGIIHLIRRVPPGSENAFPITTLLSTFAQAVSLRYTHNL